MKFWIGAAIAVLGFLFVFLSLSAIGLGVTSSGTVSSPSIVDIPLGSGPYQTLGPTPETRRLPGDCVPISTPCGTAVAAVISDYVSRTHPASGAVPDFYYADYVEWPTSCLGIEQSEQLCLQVITPGYRVFLQNPSPLTVGPQYLEYHTDLSGRVVLYQTLAMPPDFPLVLPSGAAPPTPNMSATLAPCPNC
jgi:hypothetical protein